MGIGGNACIIIDDYFVSNTVAQTEVLTREYTY